MAGFVCLVWEMMAFLGHVIRSLL